MVPSISDCFASGTAFDQIVSRSTICVSFAENLSTFEFYFLGALRGALVPTVLLTQNHVYPFNPQIPTEYQARSVSSKDMPGVCQIVQKLKQAYLRRTIWTSRTRSGFSDIGLP